MQQYVMTIYILSSLSFLNKLKFIQPASHEHFGKFILSLDCMIDLSLSVISVRELKGLGRTIEMSISSNHCSNGFLSPGEVQTAYSIASGTTFAPVHLKATTMYPAFPGNTPSERFNFTSGKVSGGSSSGSSDTLVGTLPSFLGDTNRWLGVCHLILAEIRSTGCHDLEPEYEMLKRLRCLNGWIF
jgi:hypothetical protein